MKSSAKNLARKARSLLQSTFLSYPKIVQCNICEWEGRRFLSDSWHKRINCPKCRSGIRQRLFLSALQNLEDFSFKRIIENRRVLHFAPEEVVSVNIRSLAKSYQTADFLRPNCDFQLDMSDMPTIKDESFDVVIAFDVLEHVPDYHQALEEVYRILSDEGFGIFTVPQQDNLRETYEDPKIVTPEDREKHYGQWDHLRMFGQDFLGILESKGFTVFCVNEGTFSESLKNKHVLFPPVLSEHPLATNFRRVFFCQKK